ncbi:MAG TPA: alpha/beta hydrolase [Acetobacteraceae bacterium]|nr:alpha/beta hydrolase [Acetobacteraceae bacterium]
MIPVYIDDCFGMLHPADGAHGVLICSTMGDEALNVYRPLVHLADRFAAADVPTLRLEYYGTGDSGGEDGEPCRFRTWLNNIAAGVRWLRANCGVGPVTLVGVRLGAALAARAACDIDDIASLVLLAPVASGRRFLREMVLRANAIAEIWQVASHIEDGGWFEAHGLRVDRSTRDELERLDVAKLPRRPALHALVLDQRGSPAGGVMAGRLRQLGADVTNETVDDLAEMLRDPYENAVPHEAFAKAVDHTVSGAARGSGRGEGHRVSMSHPRPTLSRCAGEETPLHTTTGQESPIFFGPNNAMFGILSMPAHPRDSAPPVLIANTGANPRSGNSRSAVTIARWLAARGIASLRMDGAGIGDSAVDTGERGQPYSAQGDRDLAAGIDELSRRFDTAVLVLGMCSGAFHALRAAYDDHRIAGLMLLNLQKFMWDDGESLSVVQRTTFRTTRFYLHHIHSPQVWQRVLHGEINIAGIGRALAGRALRRVAAAADPALALLRQRETRVGLVRRKIRGLRQRRMPILFVLSGNDPGLDEIAEYFGAHGRQFRRQPNVMFRMLEGADHTLSAHWARETLLGYIADFLRQRCSLAIEAVDPESAPMHATPPRLDAAFVTSVAIDSPGSAA